MTLTIAVAATAIVLPVLRGSPAVEVTQAGRTLAAALRRTRGEAILAGGEQTFELDVKARSFRAGGEPRTRHLPSRLALELLTARGELSGERGGAIRFYPDGSSTGGRVTVRAADHVVLVDVAWLTGRVRILEGETRP